MRAVLAFAWLAFAAIAMACHIQTPPLPVPAGGSGGAGTGGGSYGGALPEGPCDADRACSQLGSLGCVGSVKSCVDQVILIRGLTPRSSIDLDCLCSAQSRSEVRACESVICEGG